MGSSKHKVEIDEGYTLDYLIPGVFIALAAPIVLLVDHLRGGLFEEAFGGAGMAVKFGLVGLILAMSAGLIAITSGIEMDVPGKRIRVYKGLLGRRIGNWVSVFDAIRARLELTSESQTLMSRGSEVTYRTKTYDLIVDRADGTSVEIHAYTSRKLALKTLKEIRTQWGIAILDASKRNTPHP